MAELGGCQGQPAVEFHHLSACMTAAVRMAWATPYSRSSHLNTSKMVIADTTKTRLLAIKARKCLACRPLVKT